MSCRHITISGNKFNLYHERWCDIGAWAMKSKAWFMESVNGDEREWIVCGVTTKKEALKLSEEQTGLDFSVAR